MPERTLADLTPREQLVLAALKLGLPTKLMPSGSTSKNTVEMHIRHIMRKMLRWN
jgi:DNA-binding NarL/FixJ family response regulator